jgi:hypothetical protein
MIFALHNIFPQPLEFHIIAIIIVLCNKLAGVLLIPHNRRCDEGQTLATLRRIDTCLSGPN